MIWVDHFIPFLAQTDCFFLLQIVSNGPKRHFTTCLHHSERSTLSWFRRIKAEDGLGRIKFYESPDLHICFMHHAHSSIHILRLPHPERHGFSQPHSELSSTCPASLSGNRSPCETRQEYRSRCTAFSCIILFKVR